MTDNIVPLKKVEPSIKYHFTAVCLDDKFEFEKGIVYEFFYKGLGRVDVDTHFYCKEYGSDRYFEIEEEQYRSVEAYYALDLDQRRRTDFCILGDSYNYKSVQVPKTKSILGIKFKVQSVFTPRVDKKLVGYKKYEILNREIKAKVLAPLALIEFQNKDIILEFCDSIHYALSTFESFCKMADIIDLKPEIDKVNTLLMGYYSFALTAEENLIHKKKKETQDYLQKHHALMESLSDGIKKLSDGGSIK
ncbi:hypothetical protein [Bacillus inaquosorum]|uniref:hypothetical protein n=2 Tax=Bacillus inaquosorum TaxID=483913 RepID=UPI003D22BF4A